MSHAPITEQEVAASMDIDSAYSKFVSQTNTMIHQGHSLSGKERNCVFLNQGDGGFSTISALSGFDMPEDGRGLALMDWDFDGRIDFWASARTAPRLRFMHNQLQGTGDWLGLRLRGIGRSNRDAIGARVRIELSNGRIIMRSARAGEGFVSQSSKWLHFGLGKGASIKAVRILWPSGDEENLTGVKKNTYYTLVEGSGNLLPYNPPLHRPFI